MILFNDFKRQWEDTKEAAIAAFAEIGASGWYVLGREGECFERERGRAWGERSAVSRWHGAATRGCRTQWESPAAWTRSKYHCVPSAVSRATACSPRR